MMADRNIYPADAAERLRRYAGEPYRPSNGAEGEYFESAWCADCSRRGGEGNACRILLAAFAHGIGESRYPSAWVYGSDGQPECTAFRDKHAPRPAYRCKATTDLFPSTTPEQPR